MENASKALIIAGAILLSILIIALGMNVFNSANSVSEGANMDKQEIQAHNAQFDSSYQGKQKGGNVRKLMNLIAANNDEYDDRPISISITGTEEILAATPDQATIRGAINNVKTNTTYNVEFSYGGAGGLIDTCTVTLYGATSEDDET